MAKILPKPLLIKRQRNSLIASLSYVFASYGVTEISLGLVRENDQFFSLHVVDAKQDRKRPITRSPEQIKIDQVMSGLASEIQGRFIFARTTIDADCIISSPEQLINATESLACKFGLSNFPLFLRSIRSAKADTTYLKNMSKKAQPRPI